MSCSHLQLCSPESIDLKQIWGVGSLIKFSCGIFFKSRVLSVSGCYGFRQKGNFRHSENALEGSAGFTLGLTPD